VITILPVFAGCISYLNKSEGDASLETAKSLMSQGKYVASLKESEEILIRYPETHGDQALLLMGLICAYPLNPYVNYKKSLQYFDRLIKEFPLSRLTDEAGIWILTTRKLQDNEREIQELKNETKRPWS
jgi:outer membrane protein assembly factor BamD (BamD/ComL family)